MSLVRRKGYKVSQTWSFDFKYCISFTWHDCLLWLDKVQHYLKKHVCVCLLSSEPPSLYQGPALMFRKEFVILNLV